MKFCLNCGAEIREDAAFCPECGAKQAAAQSEEKEVVVQEKHIYVHNVKEEQAPKGRGANGLGIAGFILNIIGLILSWIPVVNVASLVVTIVGEVLAVVGLIVGIVKRKRLGLAIAGLVLGAIAFIVMAAMVEAISSF